MVKNSEPKLCPDCRLTPYFFDEARKQSWTNQNSDNANNSLKLCARMRQLARREGLLYLCRHFNYGLLDQPQKQPPPPPEPPKQKTAKQTRLY